jgi:hypothetical protein
LLFDQEGFVDGSHLPVVTVISPSYLGCSSSGIPADDKDGLSNGEEVEIPSLEFHLRIVKLARPKNKGRREVLNLNSSIKYGHASVSSWQGKDEAHML